MPSLAPERDQIEARKTINTEPKARVTPPSGGAGSSVPTVVLILLILALGALGWWFDMQDKEFKAQLAAAEARIHDLEQQLSATGEEMGESAVVIKARLKDLGEKSEELWAQMDKLWASAWRRNQAEIKELEKGQANQAKSTTKVASDLKLQSDTVKGLANKQTELEFNLGILSEQMDVAKRLSSELDDIKSKLSAIETSGLNKDQQQIELAANVANLERQLNQLKNRLAAIEGQVRPGP